MVSKEFGIPYSTLSNFLENADIIQNNFRAVENEVNSEKLKLPNFKKNYWMCLEKVWPNAFQKYSDFGTTSSSQL